MVGVEEKGRAKSGVALIIAPNRLENVIKENYVNGRLLVVEMKNINKVTER